MSSPTPMRPAPATRSATRTCSNCWTRGIDVFTTLNVQHVESRAEAVRQITGVTIRETLPDTVLDGADFELVDLPPEELRARLAAGKVYLPESARAAQEHFFRPGNLSALRELALRFAAEHVGQDVLAYRQAQGIARPLEVRAAPAGGRERQPHLGGPGALDAPPGRRTAGPVAGRLCGTAPAAQCRRAGAPLPPPGAGPGTGRASPHHHRRRRGARPVACGAGAERHPACRRQTGGLAGARSLARRLAAQPADSRERPH